MTKETRRAMRKAWLLLGFLPLVSSPNLSVAQAVATSETISGRNLQAIQAAMPEFNRRGGQLKDYEISVREDGFYVVVSFMLTERPEGLRGGLPGEFDVYLNKNDLSFVRVGYQR